MTETEVLFRISQIVNGRLPFPHVVEQIKLLLEREASGKGVFIGESGGASAVRLLESIDQPYRSLYSANFTDGGEQVFLCFASDQFQGSLPQRISDFVGQQLGMLLTRIRLSERRAKLKRELADLERDLATRKVMQRAEGLLIARRKLAPAVAQRWIALKSLKTGLSKEDVAGRVIAYYQATELLERRIA